MNKALSTDDFPSILPAWIREWAAACRDGQALHPIYSSSPIRPEETTLLWKILTSVDVGTRLDRVDRTFGDELRPAVQKLLIETCLVYSNSQKRPFGHPSEIKKQIGGIAASARTLADTLHKNILLLDASQNVDYLIERCKTHSPAGFVRGRSGIRRAHYTPDDDTLLLTDLLRSFADDLEEEVKGYTKRIDSFHGGTHPEIGIQIYSLKRSHRHLFGTDNHALLSALLSAINGFEVKSDRIRKSKI